MSSTRPSPFQEERVKNPENSQKKRVIIENYHGEKLVGVLHETCSKEIVVLCHGFRSSKAVCGLNIGKIKPTINGDPFKVDDIEGLRYEYPNVLVQIPMCNEKEVYEQSISAVCRIDWRKDKILIQVLDAGFDVPCVIYGGSSAIREGKKHTS